MLWRALCVWLAQVLFCELIGCASRCGDIFRVKPPPRLDRFAKVIALWSLSYAIIMTFAAFCCEPSMSKQLSRMPAGGLSQPARAAVYEDEDTPLLSKTRSMNAPGVDDDPDRVSIN